MTPEELPSLLSAFRSEPSARGAQCPDEHQVAAYIDGALSVDGRAELESHLADCDHCLALVGVLSREHGVDDADPASQVQSARADARAGAGVRSGRRRVPQWAAAAVLMIAVAALIRLTQPSGSFEGATDESDIPTTRSAAASPSGLVLLSPSPGADVGAGQLTVRWTPVPGTRYYDVRVVTDTGDVIAEEHVGGTEWCLPDTTVLQPGYEYFVHVDAFIADDNTVGSEHVAFRVSE